MALLAAQHGKRQMNSGLKQKRDVSRQYFEDEDIAVLNEGFAIPEKRGGRTVE